ncbi:fimbrial protein [Pseudomonas sp. GL-R-26]|uniref:fimbrial protein n=1 Tax=Pseudomonas sp. GL-R-26 TaxID=2832392 RepID=UPI001CBCF3E8|nr:fimbrial protein [Pseudomonas sp. GL-R-26]
MKRSLHCLTGLLGLAAGCQVHLAAAANNTCEWGANGSGTMTFIQDLGSVYIPRDAPVGSIIGSRRFKRTDNNERRNIMCDNDGSVRLTFNAQTSVPPVQGLPSGSGTYGAVHTLLPTNIPGVGARFELGFPFNGSATNAFTPDTGDSTVPFSAHHQRPMGPAQLNFANLESYITLIKTGPIAPGPQTLTGQELFSGALSGIPGKSFRVGLSGTVIQAHCGSNKVSADPVQLGDWNLADFSGPGHVTSAVAFNITLSACVADDTNTNIATANLRFEGSGGSSPVIPAIPGVFSLTPASGAKGIGIQLLRGDRSTPVELNTEVPIQQITTGDTVLDFAARFYQIESRANVKPGDAKGALNFTLTYK